LSVIGCAGARKSWAPAIVLPRYARQVQPSEHQEAMRGKKVLVTGANQGIGKATALHLARQGAHVTIATRDAEKGRLAAAEIEALSAPSQARSQGASHAQSPSRLVDVVVGDLSRQADVRRIAAEFKSRHERLDVLVNNAGVFVPTRRTSADGVEETFAVNHLAYFLLTRELIDLLKASAPSRVVNVSSDAHRYGKMHWDDLGFANHRYSGWRAYTQSKLANLLFTYELSRRLEGSGVTANGLHPGTVASGFGRTYPGPMAVIYFVGRPVMLTSDRGAKTSVYLASSAEVERVTGKYFSRCRPRKSSTLSYCEASQRKLWALSEELTRPK
jgi:NAD(P)-dependent dehydrogenase (short-subunit alcohol dehydrogenase family)